MSYFIIFLVLIIIAFELEKQGFIENAIELFQSIINDKKLQSNDFTLPYSMVINHLS